MIHLSMIIRSSGYGRQGITGIILLFLFLGIISCTPKADIEPPIKTPLSRSVLGYGVIIVSYTRVMNEPGYDGVALGIVRENTIVTVLERHLEKKGEIQEYWVLTEGSYKGWLPESVIKLYDSEGKAKTAAQKP